MKYILYNELKYKNRITKIKILKSFIKNIKKKINILQ